MLIRCLLFLPKIKERVHLNVAGLISASREEKRHFPIEWQVACLQDKSHAFVLYNCPIEWNVQVSHVKT